MVAPKFYLNYLESGWIIEPLLSDTIYAVSKRAEHFRDKERQYREKERYMRSINPDYYDKYDNAGRAEKRKEYFYRQKNILLKVLKVTGIHIFAHAVYLYYDLREYSFHEPVRRGDENDIEFEKNLAWAIENYPELTVTEVTDISFMSTDLPDILSSQFTDKVVKIVESGNFKLSKFGNRNLWKGDIAFEMDRREYLKNYGCYYTRRWLEENNKKVVVRNK